MKKRGLAVCGFLLLGGLAAGMLLPAGQSQPTPGLGLKLATPEQLRAVPIASAPFAGQQLPRQIDLSKDMPPPGRQGGTNSCVGWAVAYALKSYQEKIEEGQPYLLGDGRVSAARVFSPSFIWNQCNGGRNVPINFLDAFNILSQEGAATWADMPFNENDIATRPGPEIKRKAARYKIDYWRQVNVKDLKEIKNQLFAGYPVVIGAKVDQAFLKQPAGQTWNRIGAEIGAHAMVIVGYDEDRRAFRLMNSWGREWCEGGYCWAGYDHILNVSNEGYVAKDAINASPPVEPSDPPPVERRPIVPPILKPPLPSTLAILNVFHNTQVPNRPDLGFFMRFQGSLAIPPNAGRTDQVVVYFYYDQGNGTPGYAVQSTDRQYADINGFAACGTQVYPVPAEGLNVQWNSWIPYGALAVPVGQWVTTPQGNVYQPRRSFLVAQAVLFVDNFGVARSPFIPFFVNK
jgi:hypothetical protein